MQVEQSPERRLGEDWIRSIAAGALDRLEVHCQPRVNSRLLTPGQFTNLDKAADLVAKYRDWFDGCTDFQVEASRIERIGKRLGISYRFLLRDHEDWYRIEQQLFCTLKDGRVQQLHLLCSGFQRVEIEKETIPMNMEKNGGQDPARDALLEFYPEGSDTASTCALLTPMIKARLGEMRSMQVLEVRVNDPAAQGDVEAWSRLSGNPILKMVDDGQTLRFFVQKK
jgi:TusA-related sulfurtransferase